MKPAPRNPSENPVNANLLAAIGESTHLTADGGDINDAT